MGELHSHFDKPISETPMGYMMALSDIKVLIIPHEKIEMSDDDIYDIFQISGANALNATDRLDDKINSTVTALDSYNQRYQIFLEKFEKSPYKGPNENFFNENRDLILDIINIGKMITLSSQKNIEDITNFLSIFVNGKKFYAKDIELKLPKIGGGFETIKRTAPS